MSGDGVSIALDRALHRDINNHFDTLVALADCRRGCSFLQGSYLRKDCVDQTKSFWVSRHRLRQHSPCRAMDSVTFAVLHVGLPFHGHAYLAVVHYEDGFNSRG